MAIGDIYLSYQRVDLTVGRYEPWQFLCWITSCYLMAMAAAAQRTTPEAAGSRLSGPVPYLSYAGVGIGYGLLLFVAVDQPLYPVGGLVYGALIATVLVGARSILSLRENLRLAMTDNLTGLANRTRLHDRLTSALERSTRSGAPVAVLMLDLDGFKSVNDKLGHDAGDAMLITVARAIEKSVRAGDTTARLGGDEFAVVLIGTDAAAAAAVVRSLAAAISTPLIIAGTSLIPRASIGLAVSGPGRESVADLLRCADTSMYRVKRAARRRTMDQPPVLSGTGQDRLAAHRGSRTRFVRLPAAPTRRLIRRSYQRRLGTPAAPAGLSDGRARG
jgi:diguanylate cyclase (GGDEF)-like protein